jgi:hypothetical protein
MPLFNSHNSQKWQSYGLTLTDDIRQGSEHLLPTPHMEIIKSQS